MGILGRSNISHWDYKVENSGYFILSSVDSKFLKRHNIDMSVKDFKEKVKRSKPSKIILTGSGHYNYRHTKLYDIKNFK